MDEMLIPLQCSGINVGRICWTTVECRSETDYGKKKKEKKWRLKIEAKTFTL